MPACPYCAGDVPFGVQKCMHCGEWVTQPRQQSVRVTNIRQARDWISRLASFMLGLVALALLAGFAIYVFQMFKGK